MKQYIEQMEQYIQNKIFEWIIITTGQQVEDHLNKFTNACLKDISYDIDDAVKDLSDVLCSVAEATLPVKSGFTCVEKNPKIPGKRKRSGLINLLSKFEKRSTALWKSDFEISLRSHCVRYIFCNKESF